MHTVLLLLAATYITVSLYLLWRRPGLFASVCVNSYPLAIFFGGGIGSVICLVGALGALASWSGQRNPTFQPAPGEMALGFWLLMNIASLFASLQIEVSGLALIQLAGLGGGMYVIGRTYGGEDQFMRDLILGCMAGVLICTPALVAAQISAPIKDVLSGRLGTGSDLSPVGLAFMVEIPLAGALAMIFFDKKALTWLKLLLSVLLFVVLIPLSLALGTRSLIAGGILIVGLYLLLHAWHVKSVRYLLISFAALVVMATAAFVLAEAMSTSRLGSLVLLGVDRLTRTFASGKLDTSALQRLELYKQAWQLFTASPLLGHGIGSFQYLADTIDHLYPHNLLLELLVNNGLVGTFIFLAGLLPLCWRAAIDAAKRPVNWISVAVLGMLAISLFRQQVSGSVAIAKLLFFALGIVAARVMAARTSQADSTSSQNGVTGAV